MVKVFEPEESGMNQQTAYMVSRNMPHISLRAAPVTLKCWGVGLGFLVGCLTPVGQ